MAGECNAHKRQFTFKWQLKFIAMIIFTACLFFLKIIVGHVSKSMALVADSFHMITDFAALTVGYIALKLANSRTKKGKLQPEKFTFGWIRAEVLGGLINTVFLFALCFSVFVSSLKRLIVPEKLERPNLVLIVGCISLFVNFVGLFLFRSSRDNFCQCCFTLKKKDTSIEEEALMQTDNAEKVEAKKLKPITRVKELTWQNEYQTPHSVNIRGVYLHILEHFLASLIVIISATIVKLSNASWTLYVDPVFTILVVLMILYSTVPLFRETIILFMQSVPANIQVKDMEERLIRRIPSVLSVHEFHLWQLGGDKIVASAHILFGCADDYKQNSEDVKLFFQNEGIACMTFQPEFLPPNSDVHDPDVILRSTSGCFYSCSKDDNCVALTCCGEQNSNDGECRNREGNRRSMIYESGI